MNTYERLFGNYEFCPNCEANLTKQKDYSNELPYWVCRGCGMTLVNPEYDKDDSGITWICDHCGAFMNSQPGFNAECDEWICTECGGVNKMGPEVVYESDEEYQAEQNNPYKGLSDEILMELLSYKDCEPIDGRDNVVIVKHIDTGIQYIKKYIVHYNRSIYDYLKANPIKHMPKIIDIYESDNCLIVIEDLIDGQTLADLMDGMGRPLSESVAVYFARQLCTILIEMHNLPKEIIHRDIKPSNIMVSSKNELFLLDVNAAKWYDPHKTDDTVHMGTRGYAAPEQAGFGVSSSSPKTDIYAMGVLMNVMLTGKHPKEEKAQGVLSPIIERCMNMDVEKRYDAEELLLELDRIGGIIK